MRLPLWLAATELMARKTALATGVGFVAAAVALLVGVELAHRARESAVAQEMDLAGPAMRVVPTGIGSMQLKRLEIGAASLPESATRELSDLLGDALRVLEGRLVVRSVVNGHRLPVIGVAPDSNLGRALQLDVRPPSTAVLGADAARLVDRSAGSTVRFEGTAWTIGGIADRLGTEEDAAIFVRLGYLQRALGRPGRLNELRVFTAPNTAPGELAAMIARRMPGVAAHINANRGNEAERQTEATLVTHRQVIYGMLAAVVALGLIISAFINARERRAELAMLFVIGAERVTVAATVLARSALVGFAGSLLGLAIGYLIAAVQNLGVDSASPWSWTVALLTVTGSIALSAAAAAPVSLLAARGDHARALP